MCLLRNRVSLTAAEPEWKLDECPVTRISPVNTGLLPSLVSFSDPGLSSKYLFDKHDAETRLLADTAKIQWEKFAFISRVQDQIQIKMNIILKGFLLGFCCYFALISF